MSEEDLHKEAWSEAELLSWVGEGILIKQNAEFQTRVTGP